MVIEGEPLLASCTVQHERHFSSLATWGRALGLVSLKVEVSLPFAFNARMESFLLLVLVLLTQWALPICLWAEKPESRSDLKLKVKAIRVATGPEVQVIQGMGSVKCFRELELGFDETGVLSEVMVRQGDAVEQGQVLAKLESSVVAAEKAAEGARLNLAEAEVRYYEDQLKTKQSLAAKDAVSKTEIEKAILELEKAKASAKLTEARIHAAQTKLERRILRAPISGLVSERYMDVGSVLAPSSNKVFSLVQCRTVYAEIELGEKLYAVLEAGMRARIQVDALGAKLFHGQVVRVSPGIEKKNRTFTAIIEIDNPTWVLRSGMFVRAEIAASEGKKAFWVPVIALVKSDGSLGSLFVIKEGVALRREVHIGERSGDKVKIVSGLAAGELIVVAGQDRLSDLDEVQVEIVESLSER